MNQTLFKEDIMFRDILSSINKQRTISYQHCEIPDPTVEKVNNFYAPQQRRQTQKFEEENTESSLVPNVFDLLPTKVRSQLSYHFQVKDH